MTFKRSSRIKKSKKFFGDETVDDNHANTSKSKSKGKPNKRVLLPGLNTDETLHVPVEINEEPTDEEDLWLEALEKGELDDNGEIPRARDPSLMTARQRALLDRTSSILIEEVILPSKEETEEARKKRLEKNRQRKLQAVRKAKETQKQTIRKLIEIPKTSKDKQKGSQSNSSSNKPATPMIKYINNAISSTLSYPEGFEYPLVKVKSQSPNLPRFCAVCGERRKYSCSKTNVSLCSLNCYKENLKRIEVT